MVKIPVYVAALAIDVRVMSIQMVLDNGGLALSDGEREEITSRLQELQRFSLNSKEMKEDLVSRIKVLSQGDGVVKNRGQISELKAICTLMDHVNKYMLEDLLTN